MTDTPYDPAARRDTPLALKLKERIRREGPITVEAYMQACLQDPEHGYYRTKSAIGAEGDFVTAPEISQVFGELIGLWCAVVWQQMGSPAKISLVELGPGRGTLMRDALRASRVLPGFKDAIVLSLVETNIPLHSTQAAALVDAKPQWLHSLVELDATDPITGVTPSALPALPTILIANEFLDTQPVHQVIRRNGAWFERTVMLDECGVLVFGCATTPLRNAAGRKELRAPVDGDIIEIAEQGGDVTSALNRIAQNRPVAALLIDYGHVETGYADTLQAVRGHKPEHPLTSPGEADLTAQVDFEQFANHVRDDTDFAVNGPVTQAEFLGSLGIMERASALMAANPAKAAEIEMGVARLMAVPGMGSRFKAIGLRSPGLPPLPGF